jgi:hypothetical protein
MDDAVSSSALLKLAFCASFHFILEISWTRWGS